VLPAHSTGKWPAAFCCLIPKPPIINSSWKMPSSWLGSCITYSLFFSVVFFLLFFFVAQLRRMHQHFFSTEFWSHLMLICHAGKPVLTENSTKFFDAFKWKRRQYELDEYIEVQLNNTKRSGKSSKLAPGATVAQIHCLWEDDEGEHMELRILFRYGDHIFNDPLFGM
jgi:hypothetical protein